MLDALQLTLSESETQTSLGRRRSCAQIYAQPVPVEAAEPLEVAEEATEDEETAEEPTFTFAQGYGRFAIRCTRLANSGKL